MKILKDNLKVIIAFVLGAVLTGEIVYAATSANQVTYATEKNLKIKNVEEALNDLYSKKNMNLEELFEKKSIKKLYGVTMEKDEAGDYYYNFDGSSSYIELNPISSEIDISDGFKVEIVANCNSLGNYAYMILLGSDFGISTYAKTNTFRVFGINTGVAVISGEKHKYTIEYNKNSSELKLYIDDEIRYTNTCTLDYTNLNRTTNYIAKSMWSGDAYFSGRLYSIDIMKYNGEKIFSFDTK